MKTLRIIILAILLVSSFMVISKPATNGQLITKAQQKLYKDFKSNLIIWNVMNDVDSDKSVEFVVYCAIDNNNEVQILRIVGENNKLKNNVTDILETHPIKASGLLKNSNVAFKLRFEKF